MVAIDTKTLLMLVTTVRELNEGVATGQENSGGSSPHTRSPGLSADEAMMETRTSIEGTRPEGDKERLFPFYQTAAAATPARPWQATRARCLCYHHR